MKWLGACAVAQPTLFAAVAVLCLSQMDANAGAQTMAGPGQGANQTLAGKPGAGPAQTAPSPPPMAAPSQPDDPAKVAAARQFITLYHPNSDPAVLAKKLDQFLPKMAANEKKQNPKLDVKKFEQERRAMILGQATRALDLQAHVVSRHFTMDELKQLSAFYGGPLGRKLADETPKIQMDLMAQRRQQMLTQPIPGMKPQPPQPAPSKGAAPHK